MERPISIYNCDKQELIGVFSELMILAKYLRPEEPMKAYSNLFDALKRGGAVRKTVFDFRVAIRYATEDQIKGLNNEKVLIMEGYPYVPLNKMVGYTSTRSDLYKRHTKK